MIPIKFRAWDKINKRWIEGFDIDNNGRIWHNHFGYPNVVIMQFTGLLDKNGKEIWEGDIIHWFTRVCDSKDEVECFEDIELIDGEFRAVYKGKKKVVGAYAHHNDLKFLEIVGNVYENPNLLKGGMDGPRRGTNNEATN